ncbi:MAG TPA: M48 family metalloprotease [Candidatus Tumulicola sp.]|nr:M48 family metalloprotease [Candidatus Tumulicola sp.]
MPFPGRRIFCGAIAALALAATLCAAASAAFNRPNELDRRVDAIPAQSLLAQPASALVDPARQAAAVRLGRLTLFGWIASVLLQAGALAYFWSSGAAAAWRDRLRGRLRAEWLVRFAFGATLGLIARAAALLPSFYLYRVERVMDLSIELTRTWAFFWAAHTLLAMVVAGAIAAIVLWLVDRTHQWYAYTIVVILGVSVAWSYASPYFEAGGARVAALPAPLQMRIDRTLARGGAPPVPVFAQTALGSPLANALVLGLGSHHRVVLTRSLLVASTPPEIVYRVSYELGHAFHADPLFVALIEGGIIIVFSAIAVVFADRVGFRRDDDPLSRLALVGALLAIVYLAAVPVRNAALRSYDLDADRYAVAMTHDRAAAVRAIVREADQRMEEVCPESLANAFLDVHPSPGSRVAAINGVTTGCP